MRATFVTGIAGAISALALFAGLGCEGKFEGRELDPIAEALINTRSQQNAANCTCYWADWSYLSEQDCVELWVFHQRQIDCFLEAYTANQGVLHDSFACELQVDQALLTCLQESQCDDDAITSCYDSADQDRSLCPGYLGASYDAFYADEDLCLVGEPGGCPNDATSRSTLGAGALSGSVEGAGDDSIGTCTTGFRGADWAMLWTALESGTYVFDTAGSEFDTVLYLLDSCGGLELACNDDEDFDNYIYSSRLEVALEAGRTVVVVVDGWGPEAFGRFLVNISPKEE